jgi:tetratricopeptide (TPR) repeat protein
MFADRNTPTFAILKVVTLVLAGSLLAAWTSASLAQSSKESEKPAGRTATPLPGSRILDGEDARRAADLDKAIKAAQSADRWDEAIARAEELLALRTRVQGAKHFEAMNAKWLCKTLRQVAPMSKEDRVAYQSANAMHEQGEALLSQGKYAQAQQLVEKALKIRCRLLTDDHPDTAETYNNLAMSLNGQGKYAQAQLRSEKSLEIFRRVFTDDHPNTAGSYTNLAYILYSQGKYAQAQLFDEKGLLVNRRLFGDNDPRTAVGYNGVAMDLQAQGKYAAAQPLCEKALEIRRETLADGDPTAADSYNNLAMNLNFQGKYAQAQPLFEKALEIYGRLPTDEQPHTAISYSNLAISLDNQGKYAEAQPLHEKALEISHILLTNEHPDMARSYNNLATNLNAQGKFTAAQPLFEKALEIYRRLLTDKHPNTAAGYGNLGTNLIRQGKFVEAQPLIEKALEIRHHLLSDEHPKTVLSSSDLAVNLNAQGRYTEARDQWLRAVKSLDKARIQVAFAGLERAETKGSPRPALAAVLARLGRPDEAWQSLEEDLGRGLLDELTARHDQRLFPPEQARLGELTAALERLDKLVETSPRGLDQSERAKQFEDLRRERENSSIALGEFQTQLHRDHKALAGQVAKLNEIQAALPADAALVAWVDIPPAGPNAADPDGEHWGVIVRSRGVPAWTAIAGTGPGGLWTQNDTAQAEQFRTKLRSLPGACPADLSPILERLRAQRLEPLAKSLGATADGLPAARELIILPSRAMSGIPIESLLTAEDTRVVSYAPSATVYKYLREQPRPGRHAGLLAVGDPIFKHHEKLSNPKPLPDHGLLVKEVVVGSNAATHGLKPGDVLLTYNNQILKKTGDLKAVPDGNKPIPVEVWREGISSKRDFSSGRLGVRFDRQPAPVAIAEQRKLEQVLRSARGGGENLNPLPGTRSEVKTLAQLFESDDRPTKILLAADASEPELDHLVASGELGRFGYIHLATHGVIDEGVPIRSAVILTQTGLPDPLDQVLHQKPVFDGRLSVREIQRGWDLKAELVTLSACDTALGREAGGEGFVGFTQALLMSGARSICLSLWKVDDTATALLMQRFYANLLGRRNGLTGPLPKAEALREAKSWLRGLTSEQVDNSSEALSRGEPRERAGKPIAGHPYNHPHYWAAFILVGDPS